MRFKKLMNQFKTSSKTPSQYLEEDELANPYDEIDLQDMALAVEKGISPEELNEIIKKKKAMKEAAERLRMKQEK